MHFIFKLVVNFIMNDFYKKNTIQTYLSISLIILYNLSSLVQKIADIYKQCMRRVQKQIVNLLSPFYMSMHFMHFALQIVTKNYTDSTFLAHAGNARTHFMDGNNVL